MLKKLLSALFAILLLTYLVSITYMYFNQTYLVYEPEDILVVPAEWGVDEMDEVELTTTDGLTLKAWYKAAEADMPTVMYYHGKGMHLGTRTPTARIFMDKGYGVLMLSYRGFAGNPGTPSEQGLYKDARAALDFLKKQDIPWCKKVIYGSSLGSAIAVQMAAERPAAAVILEAPFTTIRDVASLYYPYLPIEWIMRDHYDSLSKINKIESPLLILHGEQDAIVPAEHGRKLFQHAIEPKEAYFYPDKGHGDFTSFLPEVDEFIQRYLSC